MPTCVCLCVIFLPERLKQLDVWKLKESHSGFMSLLLYISLHGSKCQVAKLFPASIHPLGSSR